MNTNMVRKLFAFGLILSSIGPVASLAQGVETPINTKVFGGDCCDCKATSQTFFSVRPPFQLNSPEFLANAHDRLRARGKDCHNGFVQFVPFAGKSTNGSDLGRFFSFDCKRRLHVTEVQTQTTDILANQLNIFTQGGANPSQYAPFESYIEFDPTYTFAGVGITYKQEIMQFCDGRAFWFLASAPITYVQTRMNLCETIVSNGGGVNPNAPGAVATVSDAFAQSSWNYGRIFEDTSEDNKTKLGDVTLLLGYEVIRHADYHADGFAGILIPTGNNVRSKTLFEPVVGHNRHTGLIMGASGGMVIWECPDRNRVLSVEFDSHGMYLFKHCEVRSFDLKNKPYSRYMQVYADENQALQAYNLSLSNPGNVYDALTVGTPGINVFTQPLRVTPGYISVSNLALLYDSCAWQLELGYNFYARQAECVELAKPWQVGPALKSFALLPNANDDLASGTTDSVQLIGNIYGDLNALEFQNPTTLQVEYDNNLIQASDLDLFSAAHPATISHTVYASASRRWDERKHPVFIALGGSYEFENDNTTMNRWAAWFKAGVSF